MMKKSKYDGEGLLMDEDKYDVYWDHVKILCIKDFKSGDKCYEKGKYYDGIYILNKKNNAYDISVNCCEKYSIGARYSDHFYFNQDEIKCRDRIELIDKMLKNN